MSDITHSPADYLAWRDLPDGRHLDVIPLIYGARLGITRAGAHDYFDSVYDYADARDAIEALMTWDGKGEPGGWIRAATPAIEPAGFRRRSDPGDPNTEEVRP